MSIDNKRLSNMHTSDQDFEDIVYGFLAICPQPFPAPTPTKSVYQLQEQRDPRYIYSTPVTGQRITSRSVHSWLLGGERFIAVLGWERLQNSREVIDMKSQRRT